MKSRKLVVTRSDRFDHEDFDRLLEESSLNTIAAKKNQVETPTEVYRRVQDRLRDSDVACRQVDVNDFLLHLVRLYSVPNDTELTSLTLANTAFSNRFWTPRHGFQWRRDSDFACHVRADVVPGIMQTLLHKEVFSYLRQDVARSMVSLCFNSRTPLPLVILNACASAVPASSFRNELADAFMNMMQTARTALSADSWLKRPDEQDTIYHAGLQTRRQTQQNLTMTRPVDVTAQSPRPQDQRSTTDLLDLLLRACDRDPKAWEEIMRRYSRLVRSTVASFRLQEADAEDAVQNTWLRVMERMDTIRDPERLGGWLATTASRECLALMRRGRRESPDDVASTQLVAAECPVVAVVAGEARRAVDTAVAELTERRQMLIQLLFYQPDCSYAEVARNTGIPTGAIGPTRARVLNQLRRRLADAHPRLVVMQDHDDKIREVVWSQHGQLLTTASNDSTTQIEDTGNELVVLHGCDLQSYLAANL